jgi:hypothetical protein
MGVVDAPASSREHLQRQGTDKPQYAEIVRVDNHVKEARNAVAGDKRGGCTHLAFNKEAQQLQQDFTRMPPRF